MSEKMFCSQCGSAINSDDVFCSQCGTEIKTENNQSETLLPVNIPQQTTKYIILWAVGIIILALVVSYFLSRNKDEDKDTSINPNIYEQVK